MPGRQSRRVRTRAADTGHPPTTAVVAPFPAPAFPVCLRFERRVSLCHTAVLYIHMYDRLHTWGGGSTAT